MPYEIRKVDGKFAVAKKGAMGVKKAYAKLDDAKRYMRALYANENDPGNIVAALEAEELDEVIDAAVSDKVAEAERKFQGNLKPNLRFEPERPLVAAIKRAGSMTASSGPKVVIGKPAVHREGIGTAVSYTEKDGKKLAPDKASLKKAIQAVSSASDPAAAKKRLVKRARELGAEDLIPDSWGVTAALGGRFDESKHRRAPKGVREGGRFVSVAQGPGSYTVEDTQTGETIAETRTAAEATAIENEANAADAVSVSDGLHSQADTLESEAQNMRDIADTANGPVGEQIAQRADELDRGAQQLRDIAKDPSPAEYADLTARAEVAGIPTSLDDPLSPDTVPELAERVHAAETGSPVDYSALADDASARAAVARDTTERNFWLDKSAAHRDLANASMVPVSTPVGAFDNGVEFHQIGDQVYRVPAGAPVSSVTGLPMGARWESSVAHWDEFKGMEGTVPFQATRPKLPVGDMGPKEMFRAGAESAIRQAEQMGGLHAGNAEAARAALAAIDRGDLVATDADYLAALDRLNRAPGSPERSQLNSQLDVVKGLALGKLPRRASGELELSGITASAAGMAPDEPPLEWFDDPEFDELTPLTITPEGRVYGHVAPWNACHTGIQGRCVKPPRSSDGVPYFNLAAVRTAEGVEVPVGKITMDTGHASLVASPKATAAHYDNTGTVAADVRAGQDRFGPWVAGAIRPDLDAVQVRALERATVSGDWRTINGKHEMVGLLAVNVPGFPIPRAQVSIAASGEEMALVAAGVICDCDETDDGLDEVAFDDAIAV